ncbi:MAG: tetratricopeptide repeat protein [Pleurocapsa minor HA4230-MV1]|jgi:cytochrome c-type biogenesis protein CcmH/NrfG|nr:tetratricopeptide repeat protein [Pleurocapsa minor HA4230-MV1]
MVKKKNKQETKGRKLSRIVTLVLGLGFAASTLAIALSSVFSQSNSSNVAATDPDAPTTEEQIQLQVTGYEKVLEREPKNVTALEGLAQIYIQTNPKKAIPTLEKLVQYYPEQPQYAGVLKLIKQQEAKPTPAPKAAPESPASSK